MFHQLLKGFLHSKVNMRQYKQIMYTTIPPMLVAVDAAVQEEQETVVVLADKYYLRHMMKRNILSHHMPCYFYMIISKFKKNSEYDVVG